MPLKTLCLLLCLPLCFYTSAQKQVLVNAINSDTVLAVASRNYENTSFLTRLLFGTNYRSSWSTPVKLPVFYMSRSGFKIQRLGGSKQTNTLYLTDSHQQLWVLRSVDKDVKRGIISPFQYTPFLAYKKAQISGAHPYAASVAAALCKAVGVAAATPTYFYVADDAGLGEWNDLFANTVCMLEKRDPVPGGIATEETDTVLAKRGRGKAYPVLQKQLLKARLVDMLLGDWDRHAGQWRWAVLDSGGKKWYYAIPRDRDFSLYAQKGLIPSLAKFSFEPYLIGFRDNAKNLKKLSRKAWAFDKDFLQGLSQTDWEETIRLVQHTLTDKVLQQAVQKLPQELHAVDVPVIMGKLKKRRDGLMEGAISYYRFLSHQ